MIFKIKTSAKTMEYFEKISASENLPPYILSKLSMSQSLKSDKPLDPKDFTTDSNGLELNRQTITGDYDNLYKCLIEMFEHKHITDEEFFPTYVKAHLDRGAAMLFSEFKYNKDFLVSLLNDKESI